jgi:nucleoside-diphosphate-sugar epimerase
MKRVVVVGGCGFIGSRLALSLASSGGDVTVLDLAPPPPELIPLCRVERRDLTVRDSLLGVLDGADAVYLCAALLAKQCAKHPALGWAVNVAGTAQVLSEILAAGQHPRVVFLSSGTVYASAASYPVAEDGPTEPRDIYTASKLAGERIVASAAGSGRLRASVLRLFTVYGPGPASGRRGHFVAGWMERSAEGRPLTIVGDGSQTVDLTHVDDVVRACQLAAEVPIEDGECRAYNVGSDTETPIRDVARWMCEVAPALRVTNVPAVRSVLARQFADIARARSELAYSPSVRPEDGIKSLLCERLGRAAARAGPAALAVADGA